MAPMKTMALAIGGKTDYKIVVSSSCSPSENHAANELKRYLNAITNADYDLVMDRVGKDEKEINRRK